MFKDLMFSKSSKDIMLISWLRGSFILVLKISFKIADFLPHKITQKICSNAREVIHIYDTGKKFNNA